MVAVLEIVNVNGPRLCILCVAASRRLSATAPFVRRPDTTANCRPTATPRNCRCRWHQFEARFEYSRCFNSNASCRVRDRRRSCRPIYGAEHIHEGRHQAASQVFERRGQRPFHYSAHASTSPLTRTSRFQFTPPRRLDHSGALSAGRKDQAPPSASPARRGCK